MYTKRRGNRRMPLEQCFWEKVDKRGPTECWPWLGATTTDGYGKMTIEGRKYPAHKLSLELARGEKLVWPFCALHQCDNRPCVNPGHLFKGTRADNVRDMVGKGRHRTGRRILTLEQVREIRVRDALGETRMSLARAFGVSDTTIFNVAEYRRWTHAGPLFPRREVVLPAGWDEL